MAASPVRGAVFGAAERFGAAGTKAFGRGFTGPRVAVQAARRTGRPLVEWGRALVMAVRSAEIIHHLPALRRYATALIGSQARADELVELCLERLLAEQDRLDGAHLRLGLYAMFDQILEHL